MSTYLLFSSALVVGSPSFVRELTICGTNWFLQLSDANI